MNTWPGGRRHAMEQREHEQWNARHCPGTRQLCAECDAETGRCEDDSLYAGEDGERGPLCEECWQKEHDCSLHSPSPCLGE
jgi:hypothetical protein